jgi:hypothetical protein
MPRRTTPRPEQEALAISKALRKRYITPEAEATAKRLLAEQQAAQATETPEEPFSASERQRAAEILSVIRKKYPPKH